MKTLTKIILTTVALSATCALAHAAPKDWGVLPKMHDYATVFGLDENQRSDQFKITALQSNAPGNVFVPDEQPKFTVQIENLTDKPLQTIGRVEVIRYAQRQRGDDQWIPELLRLDAPTSVPLTVDLPAKGWANVTVEPPVGALKGGYGVVVDLGEWGRHYLTSLVRTFAMDNERVQYPKQSLEDMPPAILERLGVKAVRWALPYVPSDAPDYDEQMATYREELRDFNKHNVTVTAEVGAPIGKQQPWQPLGMGRPHLNADGTMKDRKTDLAWLPQYDDDYQKFVLDMTKEFGWPNGPITGFMLWNEPWEGSSISGWQADMLRYRELYRRMGDAVMQARREANVDVLIGGADSSTNTWDKLFPMGIPDDPMWPKYFDFVSIHYQGLSSPVLYPQWNNRKFNKGRVKVWDTESWVANSDERFAGVVASNRAAGYDRSMGSLSRIAISALSHRRVATDDIRTEKGSEKIERLLESRPLAASYGAVQHFIGEREFKEILWKNGLPWVYFFDGLNGNADDGTIVVVGDIEKLFNKATLFDTVKPLSAATPTLTLRAAPTTRLLDFYGNPVASQKGRYTIPLDTRGFFLRADPAKRGSFARLIGELRESRVEGLEPLEIIAYDFTAPIAAKPTMRLRLTNQSNQPTRGQLDLQIGSLKLDYPRDLKFAPREQKWVDVKVTGGTPTPDNAYPLKARFDAGGGRVAAHDETMRVNWISRKKITIDGSLDDWAGALPQTIDVTGAGGPSFEEKMYLPFSDFSTEQSSGLANGYVAYDDEYFYFASKIADATPFEGTPRFATRDEDEDFYPEVSVSVSKNKKGEEVRTAHRWPDGVRRFSYRQNPAIPASHRANPADNVLIGFNAIPLGQDGQISHLPGRMPKFVAYKTTDYEYALNHVAPKYGGGSEVWRLLKPRMPKKHYFPRQPKLAQGEGAVSGARLEVRYQGNTRIVEAAIPWREIPNVRALMEWGAPVKFSFRVNHQDKAPDMELAMGRSAAEGLSRSFQPDWSQSAPNELEFGWEK